MLHGRRRHTKHGWRPADTRKLARVVDKLTGSQIRARHEQVLKLARLSAPHAVEALRLLYLHASWLDRRAMFATFAPHITPKNFPMLIEVGRDGDPFTRLLLVELFEKFEYLAAEPYLLRMLEEPDPHLRERAARALGALGTRRALMPLLELYQDTYLEPTARAAVEKITERYPASRYPDPGSLSVADEAAIVGALSALDAPTGALTQYAEAEITMREAAVSQRSLETGILGWHMLATSPRPIPWQAWHELVCWGDRGFSQIGWALLLVAALTLGNGVVLVGPVALGPVVLVLGLVSLFFGIWNARGTLTLLRRGHATFATLGRHIHHTEESLQELERDPNVPHQYELEYIDAEGHDQITERWRPLERRTWNTHMLQPMLSLDGEDGPLAKLVDEIASTYGPGPRGTWMTHTSNALLITALPLTTTLLGLARLVV